MYTLEFEKREVIASTCPKSECAKMTLPFDDCWISNPYSEAAALRLPINPFKLPHPYQQDLTYHPEKR